MSGASLEFENPIHDAVSRIRFAPHSNNLLISSWDSNLRLYDLGSSVVRLEAQGKGALLDCCFQDESIAFSVGSDCSITRHDLHSGLQDEIGNHDDLATCVEYSEETSQLISAGWDRKIMSWDTRMSMALGCLAVLSAKVNSVSLCRYSLMVAAGESVNMYDLRNSRRPVQAKESCVELPIKCVSSIPDSYEGFAVGTVDGRVSLKIPNSFGSNDIGYTFRCHPKSKNGRDYLVTVNDIAFNPCNGGVFVTGNNDGYIAAWNAQSRRRLFEFPKCPNSVASLSYNSEGQLLAVASSYTYQGEKELEEPPQIFIYQADSSSLKSDSAGSSRWKCTRR